jgi:hypothetical protein
MEDYSEYESVEEESEPEKPTKSKGKKKSEISATSAKSTTVVRKDSIKKEQAGKTGKIQAGAKKVVKGQGSLSDFFGKPKK